MVGIVTAMRFTPRKITILITGMVFTAGFAVNFGIPVFAADDYNSSRSNTSISIANQKVGDVLLRYGIGGAEINEVTDALARGISTADLKAMLVKFGVSDVGIQEVFAILDELGAGADSTATGGVVSAPAAGGTPQAAPGAGQIEKTINGAVSAPATGGTPQGTLPKLIITPEKGDKVSAPAAGETPQAATGRITDDNVPAKKSTSEDIHEQKRPGAAKIRENAKELRENFRENVKTTIGHVDHGKTARIAVAHGKGLRMLNRFRSAMARFDHILGRMESRVEKLEAQGVDISSVAPFIEKAKNMSAENEAKMEELKAKYESLLLGENVGGIAKEARAIATELKVGIENIRTGISTPDGSVILVKMESKSK